MAEAVGWLTRASSWSGHTGIPMRLLEHLWFSSVAVGIAAAVAIPVGLVIGHTGRGAAVTSALANGWRALPTLGLVVLFFKLDPLAVWPVVVALVVIAIPPILLNTEVGIRAVEREVRDAARGMGMTSWQSLWQVELPIALSVVLAGVRSATGQVVATATVAAYVGLGGLGRYVVDGYAARDVGQITGGAILIALLALVIEGAFALVQGTVRRRPSTRPAM